MRFPTHASLLAVLCLAAITSTCFADTEDENIPDDDVPAAQTAPAQATQTEPAAPVAAPAPATNQQPETAAAPVSTAPAGDENVTVSRAEFDAMQARQEQLAKELAQLKDLLKKVKPADAKPAEENLDADTAEPAPAKGDGAKGEPTNAAGNRNYLLLPDISFIGQAKGLLSNDKRDGDRGSLRLSEGEIGIQGFVYPGVKADAFITGAPAEDEPFQLEEGYLTFLNVRKGLNINVGRKFTPFGRTGQLHNHSWLYTRQLIPFRNLVAGEALTGDGVNFSYLIPTKSKLFAQVDFGLWNGEGPGEVSSNPFGDDLPIGTGAGFSNRFRTARLWLGHPVGQNGEVELGGSYARGTSSFQDDTGAALGAGRTNLTGADISYRHFMSGGKRLLLRSEYYRNRPSGAGLGGVVSSADGYYGLANMRLNPYNDIGLLYENSGFPQAPDAREKALSLIYTRQFTEQFYARLQGTTGDRPGRGNYQELQLQFVFGLGPHTHNLE